MKKLLLAIAASAMLAVATLAPTTADARCRGCGIGLGVVGGLAAGAIIGGAIAGAGPAYAYPRTYYPVAGYEPYLLRLARPPIAAPAATGLAADARSLRQRGRLEPSALLLPGGLLIV